MVLGEIHYICRHECTVVCIYINVYVNLSIQEMLVFEEADTTSYGSDEGERFQLNSNVLDEIENLI